MTRTWTPMVTAATVRRRVVQTAGPGARPMRGNRNGPTAIANAATMASSGVRGESTTPATAARARMRLGPKPPHHRAAKRVADPGR